MISAGHHVTVFNRGKSPDDLPRDIERLRGDRDAGELGLEALTRRSWDVCVDVSGYTPKQVRASAEKLATSIQRSIFISTISVYGDPKAPPIYETHPLLPPASEDVTQIDGATYGPLKVACENIIREVYGDQATILRPQIVVGPQDTSDQNGRYSYWVQRANQTRQPGQSDSAMLAPGDGSDYLQVIDVRDIALFVKTIIESSTNDQQGVFNLSGPRFTWKEFLNLLGAKNLVWVPQEILKDAQITFNELPLYRPNGGERSGLMHVSNNKARAAGLTLTDPTDTISAVQAWLQTENIPLMLSSEREKELIQRHFKV